MQLNRNLTNLVAEIYLIFLNFEVASKRPSCEPWYTREGNGGTQIDIYAWSPLHLDAINFDIPRALFLCSSVQFFSIWKCIPCRIDLPFFSPVFRPWGSRRIVDFCFFSRVRCRKEIYLNASVRKIYVLALFCRIDYYFFFLKVLSERDNFKQRTSTTLP